MKDETESVEDALRRTSKQCLELQAWQQKYREAAEMWDALELDENQQVAQAVLIAKVTDFESGHVNISMSNSDGVDWIEQVGLIETARIMSIQTPIVRREDDD